MVLDTGDKSSKALVLSKHRVSERLSAALKAFKKHFKGLFILGNS